MPLITHTKQFVLFYFAPCSPVVSVSTVLASSMTAAGCPQPPWLATASTRPSPATAGTPRHPRAVRPQPAPRLPHPGVSIAAAPGQSRMPMSGRELRRVRVAHRGLARWPRALRALTSAMAACAPSSPCHRTRDQPVVRPTRYGLHPPRLTNTLAAWPAAAPGRSDCPLHARA